MDVRRNVETAGYSFTALDVTGRSHIIRVDAASYEAARLLAASRAEELGWSLRQHEGKED